MTRAKRIAVVPPRNLPEAEKVMASYANADARIEQINASMDEQITKLREAHAVELQELQEQKKNDFKKMQMFSETNPELFQKKKSFETSHGLIGFRTGTPKAKTKRGFTWATVLSILKTKNQPEYIRTKEEPAKDLFIANREKPECITLMNEIGLEVIQEDTFYIDLKKEEKDA